MKKQIKKLIYSALEATLFRNGIERQINDNSLRFPVSLSRYFPDQYEVDKYEFLKKNISPGDTVIDIGAHIGLFTLLMANMVGRTGKVISYEPFFSNYELLKKVVALNSKEEIVDCHQVAVSEKTGHMNLFVTGDFASNASSLVAASNKEKADIIKTINLNSDFFSNRQIRALKIDAEGSEVAIFRGGVDFFRKNQPACTVELHPAQIKSNNDSIEEFIDITKSIGYKYYFKEKEIDSNWLLKQRDCFEIQMTTK